MLTQDELIRALATIARTGDIPMFFKDSIPEQAIIGAEELYEEGTYRGMTQSDVEGKFRENLSSAD